MGLFKRSRPTALPPLRPLSRGSVELPSGQHRRVAGLSFHTDTLRHITRGSPTNGASWNVSATLAREPDNPHDPSAIAVWVDQVLIGYVNREDAVVLAPLLDDLEAADCRSTCTCHIWGGHNGIFGADLWILADKRLAGWVTNQVASMQSPAPFERDP